MIGHIISLVTLVFIVKHLSNKDEWFSERNKVKRIVLIILSSVFSILYLICGILSISKGITVVSLFKMEYGLFFVYATYKLLFLCKAVNYQMKYFAEPTEHLDSIEQLIKMTMICLEDDDFEKARGLMEKVDKYNAVDQNIILLKNIVNQSFLKENEDFSESYCY